MSFGKRLTYLRKLYGLSFEELGAKLGIQENAVRFYEEDGLSPSVELLICMGGYFEVSIDYLVGVEVKKNTASKIEEVLIDVLAEFSGVISPSFIDENREIFRNLVRSDLEILSIPKKILNSKS